MCHSRQRGLEQQTRLGSCADSVPLRTPNESHPHQSKRSIVPVQAALWPAWAQCPALLRQRFGVRVPGGAPHRPSSSPGLTPGLLFACFAVGHAGAAGSSTTVPRAPLVVVDVAGRGDSCGRSAREIRPGHWCAARVSLPARARRCSARSGGSRISNSAPRMAT
jgi:hypothetical protein